MVDGLLDVAGSLMPGRGAPMQGRDEGGLPVAKLHAQQLREQVMVAIPLLVVVRWRFGAGTS